jgi:leucyl-tRNA synthetase
MMRIVGSKEAGTKALPRGPRDRLLRRIINGARVGARRPMDPERERRWQEAWAAAGLARAHRRPGREKFFALWTYPGPSGFLHLGHLRGVTLTDALHRYHRMRGRQVFFPIGLHATGLPAVTFAQRVKDRHHDVVRQLEVHGVPPTEWGRLEDPASAARYLGQRYLATFRSLGLLMDESAYVTTIDDDYQAFIRWQFRQLGERGALRQGPHIAAVCPVCGPVSVDPSETDLSSGGEAETVTYATVPFVLPDGRVLLAATLRPETVFGVTNLWVPKDGKLAVWHHDDREYLVSPAAARRLSEQHGGRVGHDIDVAALDGRFARVPPAGREVPIWPSGLVDPAVGTGVVMSVPGHAPADWIALQELPADRRAALGEIPIIVVIPDSSLLTSSERELLAGTSGPPAERAARATGASSLGDRSAIEAATERLYRLEFGRGVMSVPAFEDRPVPEVRDAVAAELEKHGSPGPLSEFSEPVICRNGHEVVLRRIPDQWFLRYGDPEWKRATRESLGRLAVYPEDYGRELPAVLDWFQDRPCTRRGRWLGTPFPADPSWVIEPIADSTFYPAYFVVRRFVRAGRVPVAALTAAFFDFVFLGTGAGEPSLDRAVQEEVREEFRYWYPLDVNVGGKEHKRVHFPVFLYTHIKLLPPELWPKAIFVHWWLTGPGGSKLSKKQSGGKAGAIPRVEEALASWGADAFRLFYALAGSPYQDVEWDPDLVETSARRLEEIERIATDAGGSGGGGSPELDLWLTSEMHRIVSEVRAALESFEFRKAAETVYVTLPSRIRRYLLRGGAPGPALERVVDAWIRTMAPLTPHLAEELGARRKAPADPLVAARAFPEPDEFEESPTALEAEAYLGRVEEDLREVLRPAEGRPETNPDATVTFFVADPWKRTVEAWLHERDPARGGNPVREVMERARGHPELAAHTPEIPGFVQRVADRIVAEPPPPSEALDELSVLRSAEGYLTRRFGLRGVQVLPEREAEAHDPLGRRARARPGRPAFYVSGPRRGVS